LVEQIAHREGIGDYLAEGVDRIHDDLEVKNWTVKGLEFAAHDGRVLFGQGLSYAVANRGADHMYSTMLAPEYEGVVDPKTMEGKPELLIERENRNAVRDSGIVCEFALPDYFDDERMATLLDSDVERLQEIGSHIITLERHFNNKRGMDRDDDRLPYNIPDFENALDEYYERRGWNTDGTVPRKLVAGFGT